MVEITGKAQEGDSWYGRRASSQTLVFHDLEDRYTEIFDSLRSGENVESELEVRKEIPDLRELLIKYGKHRIRAEFAEDQYIRKFYALVPELTKSLNLILEKVTNFGLFTGVSHGNEDPCGYFRRLRDLDLPEDIAEEMNRISDTAESICSLKAQTLEFLSQKARLFMPNTSGFVGEEIAIDLLYHAGSLRNLALMPASSIQVLGAEKALFKHIVNGSPPPKHGVIFRVKGMSSLRTRDRGKVARFIAGKVAIALRADYHGTVIDMTRETEQLDNLLKRKK